MYIFNTKNQIKKKIKCTTRRLNGIYKEVLKWNVKISVCLRFINLFINSFYLFIYSSIHLFQYSGWTFSMTLWIIKLFMNALVNNRLTNQYTHYVMFILYTELSFVPHNSPIAIVYVRTSFRILFKIHQHKVYVCIIDTPLQNNTISFYYLKMYF